jgi:quinol monooxygenase YgiN
VAKVAIIAKLTAAEGKRDELESLISDIGMKNVAEEDGTEIYALHRDKGDENVLWFYELYSGDEALGIHGSSDGMKAMGGAMRDLLGGRPEIIMLEPSVAKGLDLG